MIADTIVLDGELGLENFDFDAESAIAFANVNGFVFETGVYEPTEDVDWAEIEFKTPHSTEPFFAGIVDATEQYDTTLNTIYSLVVWNFNGFFGNTMYFSPTHPVVAMVYITGRRTNVDTMNNETAYLKNDLMLNAYVTAEQFKPGSTGRYFRPGRTYKWIAVWK